MRRRGQQQRRDDRDLTQLEGACGDCSRLQARRQANNLEFLIRQQQADTNGNKSGAQRGGPRAKVAQRQRAARFHIASCAVGVCVSVGTTWARAQREVYAAGA